MHPSLWGGEGHNTLERAQAVLEDWDLIPALLCALTDPGWVTSALWARVSYVKTEVGSQMMLSGPLNTALGFRGNSVSGTLQPST